MGPQLPLPDPPLPLPRDPEQRRRLLQLRRQLGDLHRAWARQTGTWSPLTTDLLLAAAWCAELAQLQLAAEYDADPTGGQRSADPHTAGGPALGGATP